MDFNDLILFNGDYLKESLMQIPLNNRALNYGDGLFETMRSNGQHIHFFRDHYQRMRKGADILQLNWPELYTEQYLEQQIQGLLHRKRLYQGARVKLSIHRKSGGLFTPKNNEVDILVQASFLDKGYYTLNEKGLVIDIFPDFLKSTDPWSFCKSINALPYVLAGNYARNNQLDDVILLNKDNRMCEATSSNLFLVIDNIIYTPSLSEGCVHGIMAQQIVQLAKQLGVECKYAFLEQQHLELAQEAFLTNSISGLRWIVGYKKQRYTNRVSRKLIRALNELTSQ